MATIDFHSNADEIIERTGDAVEAALEAIGQRAEGYAKLKAPVDTGRLRNSITHEQRGRDTEVLGTVVEYAPYVEYGTRRAKAQPYFKPAVQDHVAEYKKIAESHLQDM